MGLTLNKLRDYSFKDRNRTYVRNCYKWRWNLHFYSRLFPSAARRVTVLARDSFIYFVIVLGAYCPCFSTPNLVLTVALSASVVVKEVIGQMDLTYNVDVKE